MEGESKIGRTVFENLQFRLEVAEKLGKVKSVLFDGAFRRLLMYSKIRYERVDGSGKIFSKHRKAGDGIRNIFHLT